MSKHKRGMMSIAYGVLKVSSTGDFIESSPYHDVKHGDSFCCPCVFQKIV